MQIIPKGAVAPNIQASDPRTDYAKAQEKRAAAIARFNGQQPSQAIVQNQTQISPEEAVLIQAQQNQVVESDNQSQDRQDRSIVEDTTQVPQANIDPKKQPEDPTLSRQFAQLARETKTIRAKQVQLEQSYKAKEQALVQREADLAAKEKQYNLEQYIPKDRLKQNALQTLLDEGVSYDDLTQQLMNTSNPVDPRVSSVVGKLEAKIQQLEHKLQETESNAKSAEQRQYEAGFKQIRADVDHLINNDPNYETIKATRSHKDVVDLIQRTYDEDGILLSVEEAATEVENHILEEAEKLYKVGKVAKKIGISAGAQTSAVQKTQQPTPKQTQPGMRTLTNAVSSSRPLSARERAIRRAEGFKGDF